LLDITFDGWVDVIFKIILFLLKVSVNKGIKREMGNYLIDGKRQ